MTDGPEPEPQHWSEPGGGAAGTASIISFAAAERARSRSSLDEALVDRLAAAVCAPEAGETRRARAELGRAGVADGMLADRYVPEVARRLGEDWHMDRLSFAEVTIGIARLQGLLREIDVEDPAHRPAEADAPVALMVIPAGEFHTLGAMVATGQLRRRGISVRLCAGHDVDVICEILAQDDFDMVLLSWAQCDQLDSLRSLIQYLRDAARAPAPIVVGGAVTSIATNIEQRTGADYATSDIDEAVRLCGLMEPLRSAGGRARRS